MRRLFVVISVAAVGSLSTFGAALAVADSVATNAGATAVTSTSAALNGVANSSDPDSSWAFQYGTSTSYGKVTPVKTIGTGSAAVSAAVAGLTPNTTYHFRLVVIEGSYPSVAHTSADGTFQTLPSGGGGGGGGGGGSQTAKFGKTSLRSLSIKVRHGVASVPLKCAGPSGAACKGKFSLSARGKIAGTTKTVSCGSARFSTSAGHSLVLRPRIGGKCQRLLNAAKRHRLRAKFIGTFSTHQAPLRMPVTLHR
jgi:hypothetical protein